MVTHQQYQSALRTAQREIVPTDAQRTVLRNADARSAAEIAAGLLKYLARRLGTPNLRYASEPIAISDGWETYIYNFQLQGLVKSSTPFAGPLTLRLFPCAASIPRGKNTFAIQRHMDDLGFPVPRPFCWEQSCDILGGPFCIMEQIPGRTLFQAMLDGPWNLLKTGVTMAKLQARLHKLPIINFPAPGGPFLKRRLEFIQGLIQRHDWTVLLPALRWLVAHRPASPASPSILHLDFHPINLIESPDRGTVVLDWDSADVGDPHADIATTLMLIRCAPNLGKTRWEKLLVAFGRRILEGVYLRNCRRRMELDEATLDYYQALAVVHRLCGHGHCLEIGSEQMGVKASWPSRLRHKSLDRLSERFEEITGVRLYLAGRPWDLLSAN
jgi:aminoglycoside phosphotransferase (APT) family kinase protein